MVSRLLLFTVCVALYSAWAHAETGFEDRFLTQVERVESHTIPFSNFFLLIQNTKNFSFQSPMKMHGLIGQYLDRLFKDRKKGEKEYFLRQYLDKNQLSSMSLDDKALFEKNIKRMLNLIYGEAGANFLESKTCVIKAPHSSLDLLLGQLKDFENVMRCRDLKVGDSNVFDQPGNPTENEVLDPGYSIERVQEKKFLVRISLNYRSEDTQLKKQFEASLQSCLDSINPYLLGPGDTQMEIQNIPPAEITALPIEKRPPVSEIDVMESGARSNSKAYSKDADCGTISHEVFHLLGLADEYQEKWDYNTYDPVTGKVSSAKNAKEVFNYNCRIVPPVPSMMKNPWEMIKSAQKSLLYSEQFERVLGGLCHEKGANYFRCAQFAYVTDPTEKCEAVPKECKDVKTYLGEIK